MADPVRLLRPGLVRHLVLTQNCRQCLYGPVLLSVAVFAENALGSPSAESAVGPVRDGLLQFDIENGHAGAVNSWEKGVDSPTI